MVTKSFKGPSPSGAPGAGYSRSHNVEDGCVTNKNSSPGMPQPVAVSILLRTGTGTTVSGNVNNNYSFPLPQSQDAPAPAPPAHATPKPHEGGSQQQAMKSESQLFAVATGITGANSGSASHQINHIQQAKAGPIKRTKKVAKPPKTKKSASRATKLPTKGNRVANGLVKVKPTPPKKKTPSSSVKTGGKTAKKKSKRPNANANAKSSPSAGEPAKKRAKKKLKPREGPSNVETIKNQTPHSTKQGGESRKPQETSPTSKIPQKVMNPSTVTSGLKIGKVVSIVVDAVVGEINEYLCASLFTAKQPKVVICGEDDEPNKKSLHMISAVTKPMSRQEFLPNEESTQVASSSENENAKTAGYSVRISDEGTIQAVKTSGCVTQPSKASTSTISASHPEDGVIPEKCPPQGGSTDSDLHDVSTVVMAVRRFALGVYRPFLLSAMKSMGNKSPNADRIRLSTLLAIREMLIMNAGKLFTIPFIRGSSISMRERNYLSHVSANTIVRNTAKKLHARQPEGHFFADFIKATHSYDTKSDDFQFSLARADVRSVHVHPMGKRVGQEESLLAKVSFNCARARHPLLCNRTFTLKDGAKERLVKNERSINQPVASACAMFHIETASEASASDEIEEKDAKILASLREVLRGKRV